MAYANDAKDVQIARMKAIEFVLMNPGMFGVCQADNSFYAEVRSLTKFIVIGENDA